MELLKALSANELVAQIAGFLVLLSLLRVFAWKKLLKIIDDRREKISSEFKKIEDAKNEIAILKTEYDRKLTAIEEGAREKIQQAIVEGKKIAQEIREKAQDDSRVILDRAKDNIEIEISKAKEELKGKIVELTIGATEKIIKEKMNEDKDKKMVSEFLGELDRI